MIDPKLIILGLGSRSTTYYLRELNKLYNSQNGGYSTCPLMLLNTNFDSINALLPYVSKELESVVSHYFSQIEKHDIPNVLVPNITLHETLDSLHISKNILHPVHLSILRIKKNKWDKIVLFGSLFSMTSSYISEQLISNGIQVILPNKEDMNSIDEVRKHIYNQSETKEIIDKYHSIIQKYTNQYPVILSCTELSILKPEKNKNLLDMAQVQIEAAVDIYH